MKNNQKEYTQFDKYNMALSVGNFLNFSLSHLF